ncbi:MAG: hypothetical protein JJ896_13885 [Rhodothermales bacterium]|nr:hypothetical protein [Rhodothermales bacterium]MBO6780740.1 hypothetical protein [Rhodothermales bacterium]
MDEVFEYQIEVLHPLAVHFPIALLIVAALVVAVWAWNDRQSTLRGAAALAVLGATAAVFAERTGEKMAEHSEGAPMVERFVELHESAADWTVLVSVALAVLLLTFLLGDRLWPHRAGTPRPVRISMALLALVAALLVAWTGHIGGVMVWGTPV